MLDASAALECGLLSSLCAEDKFSVRVDEILRGAEAIDAPTMRAILLLTRSAASEIDRTELMQSVSRDGLSERMREHVRRANEERVARRTNRR